MQFVHGNWWNNDLPTAQVILAAEKRVDGGGENGAPIKESKQNPWIYIRPLIGAVTTFIYDWMSIGNHLVMPIDIQANTSADVPPIGISGPTECIGDLHFPRLFLGSL